MIQHHEQTASEGLSSLESPIRQWWRVDTAIKNTEISRTKIYALISSGKIISVSLREKNQKKATRLICARSLNDYIESFIPTAQPDGGTAV